MTEGFNGFLIDYKHRIHDRAPGFAKSFRGILKDSGVKPIRFPRKSPNLNSFAERWARTAKELCENRMIFFGLHSLRLALAGMVTFYNYVRPHQALENKIIQPEFNRRNTKGKIKSRSQPGGMLTYDYRKAS